MMELLNAVVTLAKQAGNEVLTIYRQENLVIIRTKIDKSPLTEADLLAHRVITTGLKQLTPKLPILSEESTVPSFAERQQWQRYWLIDPMDGTQEFLKRTDDFTINIALIDNHKPVLGVVYAPALDCCYFASVEQGAFKQVDAQPFQAIRVRPRPTEAFTVVASRRHGLPALETFLQRLGAHTIVQRGSALKCCLVAEGVADIYPRLSPTSEWDTAAAQCVLEQAGGTVIDSAGKPLRYNDKDSIENPSFLAVGDTIFNWCQYLE